MKCTPLEGGYKGCATHHYFGTDCPKREETEANTGSAAPPEIGCSEWVDALDKAMSAVMAVRMNVNCKEPLTLQLTSVFFALAEEQRRADTGSASTAGSELRREARKSNNEGA